jgi:hypothetical protein
VRRPATFAPVIEGPCRRLIRRSARLPQPGGHAVGRRRTGCYMHVGVGVGVVGKATISRPQSAGRGAGRKRMQFR